ncbi:27883_t:CDS:2 [Gigaspora margarita]|uniref:27883_t:CDS:1 n=1 Tax=Gigaspora margarita TaxID=4874 RepID=A0ABN7VJV2_GIGMA|nr:27883_t:CDS:2 [Gigaspora margarita]
MWLNSFYSGGAALSNTKISVRMSSIVVVLYFWGASGLHLTNSLKTWSLKFGIRNNEPLEKGLKLQLGG